MDLAPSVSEQVVLYIEMFSFLALFMVYILMAIVFNWKITRNLGKAVEKLGGDKIGSAKLRSTVANLLTNWQDEFRRVRRSITFMFAIALFFMALADSTIITIAGTQERNDGVASQWQRWAAYTFAMILTTAAMAQYYALDRITTWLVALIPAAAGMGLGVFVSLTSVGTGGGADKVVNLSVWGPVILASLVPIFYIYTNINIYKSWWRGFPILVHVLFALVLWVILWTSPEVAAPNNQHSRTLSALLYFVFVLLWFLSLTVIVYFWKMGPPMPHTYATDATMDSDATNKIKRTVNLAPQSRNYQPTKPVSRTKVPQRVDTKRVGMPLPTPLRPTKTKVKTKQSLYNVARLGRMTLP